MEQWATQFNNLNVRWGLRSLHFHRFQDVRCWTLMYTLLDVYDVSLKYCNPKCNTLYGPEKHHKDLCFIRFSECLCITNPFYGVEEKFSSKCNALNIETTAIKSLKQFVFFVCSYLYRTRNPFIVNPGEILLWNSSQAQSWCQPSLECSFIH